VGTAAAWEQALAEKLNLSDRPTGGSRRTRAPPDASLRSAGPGLADAEEDQRPMPRQLACAQNVQIWTTSVLIGIKQMPAHNGGDARLI
jgi:hypothetical protein